jgi:hypothetical protein
LYKLEENWDGYGAKPFSLDVIFKSLQIYNLIRGIAEETYPQHTNFSKEEKGKINSPLIEPFFVPGSDSSVSFLWEGDKFYHEELDISVKLREKGWGTDISYFWTNGEDEVEESIEFNQIKFIYTEFLKAYGIYSKA